VVQRQKLSMTAKPALQRLAQERKRARLYFCLDQSRNLGGFVSGGERIQRQQQTERTRPQGTARIHRRGGYVLLANRCAL